MILLLADLRVTTFEPTAADEDNAAYAALRDGPSGRVLEVPIFRPGIHFGGVYLYYSTQAQRERPQGYSTLAPVEADEVAKQLTAINCGDWTRRPGALLRQLGVTTVVFHGGLFRDNPAAPDTAAFAWNALARHGYRPQAEGRPVTLLTRRGGGPPPPLPGGRPAARRGAVLRRLAAERRRGARHVRAPCLAVGLQRGRRGPAALPETRPRARERTNLGGRPSRAERHGRGRLQETRVPLGDEGWHLVTLDGTPGVRVVAYALN